ncbi:MAG: PAS sensor protein [Helicobacteraceae bacterium CG2_30_36_10]|nr:MAG: PAS sensor protein [Helicobacteraceae bacterium CG2_30_36_10]
MLIELANDDFIISKTDLKGRLTYVNKIFIDIAEYTEEELLGQAHNIVRHVDMPKAIFKLLWATIQKKEELFAYVINRTKGGNAYWVFANITASLDDKGQALGYYSVRRKANPQALEIIKPLYVKMLEAEKRGGIEASNKILTDILKEKGMDYNEFIISIQK